MTEKRRTLLRVRPKLKAPSTIVEHHQSTSTQASAVLDSAHLGDIIGAFGTVKVDQNKGRRTGWRKIFTLLAIMGPGLVVMVGDNDAGGVATYAQAGQNYGPHLLWTLLLLVPVLYVNQEMVVRLGAVSGVGHARLIFARFGKFWGAFSIIDLFILNALTVITEFIGVDLALSYFGIPSYIGIPAAGILLFLFASGGSFRKWERWMYGLIALNLAVIPMAVLVHPNYATAAKYTLIPNFPGGLNAGLLLLIIAIVGTTIAPWQLYFQQSNVVDKRITPRWIKYERADTAIGVVLTEIGAAALVCVTAYALGHTHAFGNFANALDTANSLKVHAGSVVGALFAIVLLDASLIGASAVTLSTTYALGDVFKVRHSLHWSPRRAPVFYLIYAGLLVISAVVVLIPNAPLGLITTGVQALAGILLPSATVFLVLLCNDKDVLGPWINTPIRNVVAGAIVWVLILMSLALTAATMFPTITGSQLTTGLLVGAGIGAAAGLVGFAASRLPSHKKVVSEPKEENEPLDKENWRTPPLDTLPKAKIRLTSRVGLTVLRLYLVLAVVLVIVKIAQLAGH
ncbi:Nramp family divalent metal transporter [Ferrimicrobium acidiphilum]|uniref:Nramp family divalent metal transporter n=1 Tax=Ferrimicrobium acidiphilum TaxID=121039 RepID=UPI0023F30DE4|nr:Nramp family divalent metal transporter [Ferrimicrobium acidiphilum]